MRGFLHHIVVVLFHMGGFGLLAMGVLDSSFLFMPLGNDLLVIAMTARRRELMPYYAAMAAVGSTLGCLLLDIVFRKGGEEMLAKHVSSQRLKYVRDQVERRAGWALAFAALMPPPFPFTPFVAASAALEYPRKKLLAVIAGSRLVRFSAEGTLAIFFGRRILKIAQSPVVTYGVIVLIVVSVAGSAFEVVRWIRRSRTPSVRSAGG